MKMELTDQTVLEMLMDDNLKLYAVGGKDIVVITEHYYIAYIHGNGVYLANNSDITSDGEIANLISGWLNIEFDETKIQNGIPFPITELSGSGYNTYIILDKIAYLSGLIRKEKIKSLNL